MSATTLEAPNEERLLTTEDFRLLPHDGRRIELVRGKVIERPPANFMHGIICIRTGRIIGNFVDERNFGWVTGNDSGVITKHDPDSVRGPDVAYFSYERIPRESPPDRYPDVAPELIFEVKSPTDRWQAITAKAGEYLTAGTITVCVLDPESKTISVYTANDSPTRKTAEDELTLPEVFPDFHIPVRQFFG